jgi:phosphoglycolate phosphatase-like HAD superfamily hydrolase
VQNGWKQKGGSFVGAGSSQMLPNKDIMRLSDDTWQWVEFKVKNKYTESKTEAKMDDGVKEALAALTAAVQKLADCYSDDSDDMDSMDEAKEPMDGEADPDGDEKDKKPMEAVDPDTAKEIEGGDKKEMYHNKESRQSNASLLRENKKLRNIERVRQLCENSRVPTTRELLEDLSGLTDEACKRQVARLATATNRPRSAGYQAVKPANGVPTGMDLGSYLTN